MMTKTDRQILKPKNKSEILSLDKKKELCDSLIKIMVERDLLKKKAQDFEQKIKIPPDN